MPGVRKQPVRGDPPGWALPATETSPGTRILPDFVADKANIGSLSFYRSLMQIMRGTGFRGLSGFMKLYRVDRMLGWCSEREDLHRAEGPAKGTIPASCRQK